MSEAQKTAAGIFLAIAAVSLAFVIYTGNTGQGVTCEATGAAMGLVAAGLSRNESAAQIVAFAGAGFLTDKACEQMVEHFVDDPEEEVDVEVQSEDGTATEQSTSAAELAVPPPPASSVPDLQRAIDCLGWGLGGTIYDWCTDGIIDPPPPSYTPPAY